MFGGGGSSRSRASNEHDFRSVYKHEHALLHLVCNVTFNHLTARTSVMQGKRSFSGCGVVAHQPQKCQCFYVNDAIWDDLMLKTFLGDG
jgi:hypothetical protein